MVDTSRTIARLVTISADNTTGNYTNQNLRDVIVTILSRTTQLRSTDPEFGAIGDGSSHPLSGIAAFSTATSPAGLAAIVVEGGATPYSWATNANYGLVFTKNTSASTSSGTVLPFSNISGDLANPMMFLAVGMTVTGTNIAGGSVINSISFTSGTPNLIDGPLAGTITLNNAITGTVGNAATLTFSYSSTMIQALQMDWLGIQAAEFAALNGVAGGHHYTPAGVYLMGSRPVLRGTTSGANASFWTGDSEATKLSWSTDAGPGTWAVVPPNLTNGFEDYRDVMCDMWLVGPGNGGTMGTAGNNMQGLVLGSKARAWNIRTEGWWAGQVIIGDHQQWYSCKSSNNFINWYYGPLSGQNNGDHLFWGCYGDGATWASVGVSGTNSITYTDFKRCHFGFAPWAFYKFSGTNTNFFIASLFERVSQESCGVEVWHDENASGLIDGCTFINCDWALDPSGATYYITGQTMHGMVYVGNMSNNWFQGERDPYTTGYNRATHPATCFIQTQGNISDTFFGSAGGLISNASSSVPAILGGLLFGVRFDAGDYSGFFRSTGGFSLTAGVAVTNQDFGTAVPLNGTHIAPIGVNFTATTGAQAAAIVDKGVINVNKHTSTDVIASGTYVQIFSGSDGTVVAFNSGARTSVVGIVTQATTSGPTTVQVDILLKGP